MNTKFAKLLCLTLACLLLLTCFVACGTGDEEETKKPGSTTSAEEKPGDATQAALDALGEIDWGGDDFTVLYNTEFTSEVHAENGTVDQDGGSSQIINDAVYERNSLFEDRCNLVFKTVGKESAAVTTAVQNEAAAPTGDFQMIDHRLGECATLATGGYLFGYAVLRVIMAAAPLALFVVSHTANQRGKQCIPRFVVRSAPVCLAYGHTSRHHVPPRLECLIFKVWGCSFIIPPAKLSKPLRQRVSSGYKIFDRVNALL